MTKRRELIVSFFERVESDFARGAAAMREQAPVKREEPTSAFALDGFVRRAVCGANEPITGSRKTDRAPARHSLCSVSRWPAISSGKRTPSSQAVVGGRLERLLIETNERREDWPNQTPEPTTLLVTIRACARLAPSRAVAHL